MKPANFAPVYCALYPALAEIARKHGYAMAIHGTMRVTLTLFVSRGSRLHQNLKKSWQKSQRRMRLPISLTLATSITVAWRIPSALGSVSSLLTCRLCLLSKEPTNDQQINQREGAMAS
ncbi:hypothetical protein AM343_001586 [Klebsiella variicola]|nr:hypothetical protein AM343_001586 [Klebsiella variicola]